MMPPEVVTLLGNSAPQRDAQLRSELLAAINEFAGEAFPGIPININCEQGPYDPAAINIYFVARDRDQQYVWAKGIILNRSDAGRVIVFGQDFWDFFGQAWGPIWQWKNEVSNRDYLSALGSYYFDCYEFYLEWAVAHEMAHIRLGHHAHVELWPVSREEPQEVAADIEAARIMRRQYHLLSGFLLGVVKETLKFGFSETYHRHWTREDGDPFESSWRVEVVQCSETHPPFLVRSLAMLKAAARVEQGQAKEIQEHKEEGIKRALSENGDLESQIALEQLNEGKNLKPESTEDSSTSTIELVDHLRERIVIQHPIMGICSDKLLSFARRWLTANP
jgi:hypothetical protein